MGLYVLPRGALRTELLAALRQARTTRRPRAREADCRSQIPNMTPIAARPDEVTTRMVPGHWEDHLLKGARNGSALSTLMARTTYLILLAKDAHPRTFVARMTIHILLANLHSPLQHGISEHTNCLLSQSLPHGISLSSSPQRDLTPSPIG